MDISNVPVIEGPNFGGVIYGLSLDIGYSFEASTLTLNVVNKDGIYNPLPKLNDPVKITFGSFVFNGIIWEYNIKDNKTEKILEIKIKDNSVILDRYYVLLWKRGMFNDMGTVADEDKTINFEQYDSKGDTIVETTIIWSRKDKKFVETKLKPQKILRKVFFAYKRKGNILYLGKEEFPDADCQIRETYYLLDDLKTLLSSEKIVQGVNFSAPKELKRKHEGTLRQVLQNWANDCGVDFYWDFDNNKIVTYISNNGITPNLPNITSPNLISKDEKLSLDGTFIKYPFSYIEKPREALVSRTGQSAEYLSDWMYAVSVTNFLQNDGTIKKIRYNSNNPEVYSKQDPDANEKTFWGGRTQEDFLRSAFLGYFNPNLREVFLFQYLDYFSLRNTGYRLRLVDPNKPQGAYSDNPFVLSPQQHRSALIYLQDKIPDLSDLQKVSPYLTDFHMVFGEKSPGLVETWPQIEQKILSLYGKFYYPTAKSFTSYFCTETSFTIIKSTVSPEPTEQEELSEDYQNKRWFVRGGRMSHDSDKIMPLLTDQLSDDEMDLLLKILKVREIDVLESGLKDLFPDTSGKTLFIYPKYAFCKKIFRTYDFFFHPDGSNPREPIYSDEEVGSQSEPKCGLLDDRIEKSKCLTAKEEALKLAEKQAYNEMGQSPPSDNPESPDTRTGLNSRGAKSMTFELLNKKVTIAAPSDASYRCSIAIDRNITFTSAYDDTDQKTFFNFPSIELLDKANEVAEIEVSQDNITESIDVFKKNRATPLPLQTPIINSTPQKTLTYQFVGYPDENLPLLPSKGLAKLDISYSNEGFTTSITYQSRPPRRIEADDVLRKVESKLNRSSFKAL